MITPTPRPALRKAPDANIHPADPGQAAGPTPVPGPPPQRTPTAVIPAPRLIHPPGVATPKAKAGTKDSRAEAKAASRLSGPPRGTTSDVLRPVKGRGNGRPAAAGKSQRRAERKAAKEKQVELTVKLPKSLRKDLRQAAKSAGRTPDEVVASLVRAWIDN